MKNKISYFLIILLLFTLQSCFVESEIDSGYEGEGYKPTYMTYEEISDIQNLSAQSIENAGKIYVYGNYLFVNELFEGIHIIDNTDPNNPQNMAFIKIPGNVDIAVKGNILYADNVTDLLTFDINNLNDIQLKNRIKDAFPVNNFPPQTGVYFECVDASKGIVTGWEKTNLENPRCRR